MADQVDRDALLLKARAAVDEFNSLLGTLRADGLKPEIDLVSDGSRSGKKLVRLKLSFGGTG